MGGFECPKKAESSVRVLVLPSALLCFLVPPEILEMLFSSQCCRAVCCCCGQWKNKGESNCHCHFLGTEYQINSVR
jgi:hypothetical protein